MTDKKPTETAFDPLAFTIRIPRLPDYLSFVDPEVRAIFEGRDGYYGIEPLLAQLIVELRKART